jgi:hypothetical protein
MYVCLPVLSVPVHHPPPPGGNKVMLTVLESIVCYRVTVTVLQIDDHGVTE